MRLLLDTQVVLWQLREPDRLGKRAIEAMTMADEARISVVSFVEIGIKVRVGKLALNDEIVQLATSRHVVALSPAHALGVMDLPLHHKDPFDRLLICQARAEGLTIVTSDPAFARYEVDVIDASR